MTNVEVSINYAPATPGAPESVFGVVRHRDGSETPYGGWLELLTVLQSAASNRSQPDTRLPPGTECLDHHQRTD